MCVCVDLQLNLSENRIGDKGAQALARDLGAHPQLPPTLAALPVPPRLPTASVLPPRVGVSSALISSPSAGGRAQGTS